MSSALDDKYALTLWELAQHGGLVEVAIFERVIGISLEGVKKASEDNQRQTFKRFREWCMAHGVKVEKKIEAGEPPRLEFDAARAREVAQAVRPRLAAKRAVSGRHGPTSGEEGSIVTRPPECVLDAHAVGRELVLSTKRARELLRDKVLRERVFYVRGRPRIFRSDLLEWAASLRGKGRPS